MTRLLVASCVAAACSIGLAAQAPAGSSKPQTTPPAKEQAPQKSSSAADKDKSMVVRGCLQAGDEAGTFTLEDASATSGGTLKNATLQLAGSPAGTNLKDHVGHIVEVTGTLAAAGAKSSAAGSSGSPGTAGTAGGAGASKPSTGSAAAGSKGKLTVKALKHVKAGC